MGIISLLVGILLPSLSAARRAAQATVCASNLRQIATAALAYAADNRGALPPAHLDFVMLNLHRWHGTRPRVSEPFDFAGSPLRPYLSAGIRRCPDFQPTPGGFEAAAGGYGYNNQYLGSSTADLAWAAGSDSQPARQTQITHPDRKIMFADAAMAVKSGGAFVLIEYSFLEPPTTTYGPTSPSIHFRHGGRANIAFADGHVTAEAFGWTWPKNAYGADNRAMNLGFFGPEDNSLFSRQ
jgi:prepilin-type processing-associated H-X9-DG protein